MDDIERELIEDRISDRKVEREFAWDYPDLTGNNYPQESINLWAE